ncbi:MAG: glycosyl transferase, partial [Gammaproteobacteria bacterium]|nr:glycosyl transferase [Gammaproteobacteria bacterium]
ADDFRPLPWVPRAVLHFICATWVIYIIGFPTLIVLDTEIRLGIAGLVFGAIALVWLLNLYNFMDGIDGIAASEALFAFAGATLIAWRSGISLSQPVIALMGVCFGFLVINWPKARVFMGDGGSGFLGLILGALALSEILIPVWSWMILLTWFIADACLTICLRLMRGDKIHEAHSLHAYQHLNRALGTPRTLLIVQGVNLIWLLPLAGVAATAQEYGLFLLILAILPTTIFHYYCGAGQPTPMFMEETR